MCMSPFFPEFSGFSLKTTLGNISFRVAISKHCILTLMAVLFSALIVASFGLRRAFSGVVDLVSEGVLFSIPFQFLISSMLSSALR